jgi:hypothetical protein
VMRYSTIPDNYPFRIVFVSNTFALVLYASGILIMAQIGTAPAIAYAVFILAFEYRLLRYHCINCYYWGKVCGFGKGKISSWFFKKGEAANFCTHEMKWKDMVPDLLVSLIPLVSGIVLLIINFKVWLLLVILLLVVLTTFGNGFIRGSLTCKYCKQRELGCPADKLFNKNAN